MRNFRNERNRVRWTRIYLIQCLSPREKKIGRLLLRLLSNFVQPLYCPLLASIFIYLHLFLLPIFRPRPKHLECEISDVRLLSRYIVRSGGIT